MKAILSSIAGLLLGLGVMSANASVSNTATNNAVNPMAHAQVAYSYYGRRVVYRYAYYRCYKYSYYHGRHIRRTVRVRVYRGGGYRSATHRARNICYRGGFGHPRYIGTRTRVVYRY